MKFSVVPYNSDSPMKPWPSLTDRAFCLICEDSADGTVFYFDSSPENDCYSAVFVLIHGLGDEADSWRHLIPLLNARGFRVLAPDLPGFGRSIAQGKINIKKHVAAVLNLIDTVISDESTFPKPIFLTGNSCGALIAEFAAFQRPHLVSGLILLDGSIPGGPPSLGIFALAKMLFSRKWYRAYRNDAEKAWESLYHYYADLDSMPSEDKDFLRQRVMARVESPAQERAFFATQQSLVWTYLSASSLSGRKILELSAKILLIWGENDRIIPLSSAELFKSLQPGITLEIIKGAGHLPHQEKPKETAILLNNFAESVFS